MDELLKALQSGDRVVVRRIADNLLLTRNKQYNWPQISEFESYAPCKVFPSKDDNYKFPTGGIIYYNGNKFYFG